MDPGDFSIQRSMNLGPNLVPTYLRHSRIVCRSPMLLIKKVARVGVGKLRDRYCRMDSALARY